MMIISSDKTDIGFVGTGVMGKSMAGHILKAGYRVHVFSRTRSRAGSLCEAGAIWEDSVDALAKKSQVIITMVGFPKDVEQIYFGPDGILENAAPGTIAVDMTTSDPGLAEKIYYAGKDRGIRVLDAPVSGGDVGAQNAALSIMVGGDADVLGAVTPLFEIMGKNIVHQGGAGKGQHTKVANQIAIAAGMVAVCESLSYAAKAGLDPETVLESIGKGAAGSWSLNNLGPRMIADNFDPGFFVKHFIKDMSIALASSKKMGHHTPGLKLAYELYQKLAENGCENDGTQALYKLFRD